MDNCKLKNQEESPKSYGVIREGENVSQWEAFGWALLLLGIVLIVLFFIAKFEPGIITSGQCGEIIEGENEGKWKAVLWTLLFVNALAAGYCFDCAVFRR